jgi:phosphoserine phosphatase
MIQSYSFEELLQSLKKSIGSEHYLIFDCDGTLLDGDVSTITGWLLMKHGMVDQELIPKAFRAESFYLTMNLLDYERVREQIEREFGLGYALEWEVLIQSGLPQETVVEYAEKALELSLQNNWVRLVNHLPHLLRSFSSQSWIVSGSSRPTVMALARKVGVHDERVIATELEMLDGIYMKRFAEPGFVWEENKAKCLQKNGVSHPLFVAGDSPGDWHMMEMATEWVWCVLWPDSRVGAKRYRRFLEEKLPFAHEIPRQKGHYRTSWQNKNWIFEVV